MALRFYDEALLNKLKKWVSDEHMKITGPEETRRLFEYRADLNNDKPIELPLITLRRGRDFEILSTNKKPLTFDGMTLNAQQKRSDMLNAIPIHITYQIDIYTRYFAEADEYIRNFIFNIINFPKLNIQIPYNGSSIEHTSNIRLTPTVSDNSDIAERLNAGQFTRMTIPIYIDDAYIFDYKFRPNYSIVTSGEIGLQGQNDFESI